MQLLLVILELVFILFIFISLFKEVTEPLELCDVSFVMRLLSFELVFELQPPPSILVVDNIKFFLTINSSSFFIILSLSLILLFNSSKISFSFSFLFLLYFILIGTFPLLFTFKAELFFSKFFIFSASLLIFIILFLSKFSFIILDL